MIYSCSCNSESKQEADSGSHSPDNFSIPDVSIVDQASPSVIHVNTNNQQSHDEGVICDQVSVASSSHSSLHSNTKNTFESVGEEIKEEKEDIPKQQENDKKVTTTSQKHQDTIPGNRDTTAKLEESNGKKKQRKTRKTRTKLSTRPEVSDTDSSKDVSGSPQLKKPPSPPLSLRGSSILPVTNKNVTSIKSISSAKEKTPVPPTHPKKKEHRKRRISKKSLDRGTPDYSALDKLGDENNIHSAKVKGIAYKSQPEDNSLFNDEMPIVPDCPVKSPSSSLSMSEYIESLMKMTNSERKLLIEHQNKRKEAFKVAQNSAKIIQRSWLRYLKKENPTLYHKFHHARRKAKKMHKKSTENKELTTQKKLDNPDKTSSEHDIVSSIATNDATIHGTSSTKSAMKSVSVGSCSANSIAQSRHSRSEDSRSSIMSSSDGRSSGSKVRNSSKTRRPKTVGGSGQSNVYVSVEKLEELSRIYGHPKIVRDMLAAHGGKRTASTSLPSINSNPSKLSVNSKRSTVSMSESIRQRFEMDAQGPIPAESPRTWASSSNVQRNGLMDTRRGSRNHPRSKSGPPNQHIDLRLLPLQWQKLYGQLQNANAADDARKYSTRFSYNMDQ